MFCVAVEIRQPSARTMLYLKSLEQAAKEFGDEITFTEVPDITPVDCRDRSPVRCNMYTPSSVCSCRCCGNPSSPRMEEEGNFWGQ